MKGTEKQISYANDIIVRMEKAASEAKISFAPYAASVDKWIAMVKNAEFASTIIRAHQSDGYDGYAPQNLEEWRLVLKHMRDNGILA